MPDSPKLSDLIEKGAAVCTPKRNRTLEFESDRILACPLGMAYIGAGGDAHGAMRRTVGTLNFVCDYLDDLGQFGLDSHTVERPSVEGDGSPAKESLRGCIVYLFDARKWSVFQIIAWLRSIGR